MLHVRVFGRDIQGFRVGTLWQALVGIDLDAKPGPVTITFQGLSAGRAVTVTSTLVVKARTFPTTALRVNEMFVNPPAAVLTRIADEAEELARLWTTSAPDRLWSGGFIRPVPGIANGAFGTRRIFNGQPRQPHSGADLLSPAGTPVLAPNDGRVVLARDLYFTGNTVVIDHGLGLFSLFAHFSTISVHTGDTVLGGVPIGLVGATGRVTGPHLHWAMRLGGARVDPLSLLALLPREKVEH